VNGRGGTRFRFRSTECQGWVIVIHLSYEGHSEECLRRSIFLNKQAPPSCHPDGMLPPVEVKSFRSVVRVLLQTPASYVATVILIDSCWTEFPHPCLSHETFPGTLSREITSVPGGFLRIVNPNVEFPSVSTVEPRS